MPKAIITIEDGDGSVSINTEFVPALTPTTPGTPALELAMDIHQFIADRIAANAERKDGE